MAKDERGNLIMSNYKDYTYLLVRVLIGVLFLITGVTKALNITGTAGFFGSLGIPGATFFAWLVMLVEIILGLALLVGWKVKYTVWPLVVILVIAVMLTTGWTTGINWVNLMFHLITILALLHIGSDGAGMWAIDRE